MNESRICIALDFKTKSDVENFLKQFEGESLYVKVGMELFYGEGIEIIKMIKEMGHKIFLDLKLHDIPNTVAQGLCSLLYQGVDIMNVHASGGYTMMKTAADTVRAEAKKMGIEAPKIIAVTILTSINEADWEGLGQTASIKDQAIRLAKLTKEAGLDGVVASPQEAKFIREACGEDFLIITPGVRPAGASIDDQSRIATPARALADGATHLVVGRPIRAAQNPVEAAENILKEMENA